MDYKAVAEILSSPAKKIIKSLTYAIGKKYEPEYVKKMADATAYEISIISKELRNNIDLPIEYKGDKFSISTTELKGILERTSSRLAYQEIRKQENIESVVSQAIEEVSDKHSTSNENIDPDWMNRFISNIGEVNNEQMQTLWAKVLARESIEPNSFSLKTLDCLRNLSSTDAMLFTKISSFVVNKLCLINDDYLNEKYGISYNDILHLDECGLLNSSGAINVEIKISDNNSTTLAVFDDYILLGKCNLGRKEVISIPEFPLTRAGRELLLIAKKNKTSKSYIYDVSNYIKNKLKYSKVTLHKINSIIDGNIDYIDEEIRFS